jgi:hypothetical protein
LAFLILKCDLAIRYRGSLKPFAMKTAQVKGFRSYPIDEPKNTSANTDVQEPAEAKISVEESLVALISERYAPAATYPEATDPKTTLDLIDEMESTCNVSRAKVKLAMEASGFKLHYTGNEFVWLLKERK